MDDRRNFFRINDKVGLKYRVVQNDDIEAEIMRNENQQSDLAELKNAFNCLDTKIMSRIERMQSSMPLVADILNLFDKKLSLMQNMLMLGSGSGEIMSNVQSVNLSASGMSFESNTPINEGTTLKVEMVLFPEYQYIPLYAKVVDCRKKIDDTLYRFLVAVEFVGISNTVQEDIMQHVLGKQANELKLARDQRDEENQTAING